MIFGYCKLGRSWNLNSKKWSPVGGDVDVYRTLKLLAERHPEHTWLLIGRNSGDDPVSVGLPENVVQFWTPAAQDKWKELASPRSSPMKPHEVDNTVRAFDTLMSDTWRSLDGIVVWAGQHGTSNSRILQIGEVAGGLYTNPQDAFVLYGSYIVRGIDVWRNVDPVAREEVWLCADPRNYIKCRDLKWPLRHPVLAQFMQVREQKFERYGDTIPPAAPFKVKRVDDGHVWLHQTTYTYDRLEMTALPDPADVAMDLDTPRQSFGMVINENRKGVTNSRLQVMQNWVLPTWPDCEIFGKWSDASIAILQRPDIKVIGNDQLFPTMSRWRSTFTTPASGSGWATAKPWECFLAGTICFFHPGYDTQGHIIPLRPRGEDEELDHLVRWLRPKTPEDLQKGVEAVRSSDATWHWLAQAQRRYVEREYAKMTPIRTIERRLGL